MQEASTLKCFYIMRKRENISNLSVETDNVTNFFYFSNTGCKEIAYRSSNNKPQKPNNYKINDGVALRNHQLGYKTIQLHNK